MTQAAVDTDVVIRLITGDDPPKQQASRRLFKAVEDQQLELTAPLTMIADCLYVLVSPRLYNLDRAEATAILTTLVNLPYFKIDEKPTVLDAMSIFGQSQLDFGDAMIVALMRSSHLSTLYSFDHDFDSLADISRIEPK